MANHARCSPVLAPSIVVPAAFASVLATLSSAAQSTGFGAPMILDGALDGARSVASADLDGDGDLDLAAAAFLDDAVVWYENLGAGQFGTRQVIDVGVDGALGIEAADLDGDGDPDLVAGAYFGNHVSWYRNLGGGSFGPRQAVTNQVAGLLSIRCADLNGDGAVDVLTGSESDDKVAWNAGGTGGSFGVQQVIGTSGNGVQAVEAADLTGNGRPDVIAVSFNDDELAWYRNLGSGQFTGAVVISTAMDGPQEVRGADLDGDGDVDLAVVSFLDDSVAWFENLGSGSFGSRQTVDGQLLGARCLEVADLDLDGDLDLSAGGFTGDQLRWYENLGPASFSGPQGLTQPDGPYAVHAADMDADGDADLVFAAYGGDEVAWLENLLAADCNGNGLPDDDEIAQGLVVDCDGNGRPDECDLAEPDADLNGDGVLDACEVALLTIEPSSAPSALGATVVVSLQNVPDGPAELVLDWSAGQLVVPIAVSTESAVATLPPTGAAYSTDVVASATVRYTDGGGQQATAPRPAAFTWQVPRIVAVTPNAVPFDAPSAITIELENNVLTSGVGIATIGQAGAEFATYFSAGGVTLVTTLAPPQSAPGDYSVELELTVGGVTEYVRADSRALIGLGPGITSLSATSGFQLGGELVVLELVDFEPGVPVEVAFGAAVTTGTPVGFLAASVLEVVTPVSQSTGVVDLTLTQALSDGTVKSVVSPSAFEFLAPQIGALSSSSGPQAGAQALSAPASGFLTGSLAVAMGGVVVDGVVIGDAAAQSIEWTTPPAAAPGLVDVTFTQGDLTVSLPGGFEYLAPWIVGVNPPGGAWYEGQSLSVLGANFSPGAPVEVSFGAESPLPGVALSASEIAVSIPQGYFSESGPYNVAVEQAGVVAQRFEAYIVLPALAATISGDAATGASVNVNVISLNGGTAYLYLAASTSPVPFTLAELHGAYELDLGASLIAGAGGLLGPLTFPLTVPAGSVPPGVTVYAQALAIEAVQLLPKAGFTQVEALTIP